MELATPGTPPAHSQADDGPTRARRAEGRALLRLAGADARDFLQGLVTNDVRRLDAGAVYAALLTPQGKYLFDFFLVPDGDGVLVDVAADRAGALAQRLALYRLRAAVTIDPDPRAVLVGLGPAPDLPCVFADPREPSLGWRAYAADPSAALAGLAPLDAAELEARRLAAGAPESGVELEPDGSYILEMGFERLHGVDFRKGCYVGQEVTARMKHKTELRKGLVRVGVDGPAPAPGTEVMSGGRAVGTLHSTAGGLGLAYLRFDLAEGELTAGAARIRLPERAS